MDSFSRFPFRVPRSAKKFVVLWLVCVCCGLLARLLVAIRQWGQGCQNESYQLFPHITVISRNGKSYYLYSSKP